LGGAIVTFDLILIGLAITLDPLPLTAFIVVLSSKRGVVKGAFFLLGWLASLGIVVAITVAATGNNPPKSNTAPSLAALAVKIAIGAGLIGLAIRQRRKMSRPKPPKKPPKWQTGVDNMSPWFALALAPTLQPWGLIAAGSATVVNAKLSSAESYIVLFLFCILASASYIFMEVYGAFRPEKSQAMLTRIRTWIDTHTDQVIVVGCLVVGSWLISKSLYTIFS
jgi:hypothetical protein